MSLLDLQGMESGPSGRGGHGGHGGASDLSLLLCNEHGSNLSLTLCE